MTTTFETAKVGDRVYSLLHGRGVIEENNPCASHYHIRAKFDKSSLLFTVDGKYQAQDPDRCLFWDKPTITAPAKPEPKVAPPVDTLVEVRDHTGSWLKAYSAGKLLSDGFLRVYTGGRTSKTALSETYHAYDDWRIVEEPDSEGWIKWSGGDCPVDYKECVRIRLRNGEKDIIKAGAVDWTETNCSWGVVAYKVVK